MKYFVDMDGVLADFNAEPNAVERFKIEKDFFLNLKPIAVNVKAVKHLISKGEDVTILTTSPHAKADRAKAKWLKRYGINAPVIFGRPEKAKIDYLEKHIRANSILIDDYGKNVREWVIGGGGGAFKIMGDRTNLETFNRVTSIKDMSPLI